MSFVRRHSGLTTVLVAFLEVLTFSPVLAGPPFITDDPEPVDLGHWEVYVFSAGAFDHGSATGVGPSVEINYGAAPNLQLHVIANTSYDAPGSAAQHWGIGDTELGAKYRFVTPGKNDWFPQVGVFPLVEIPTGDARRGLGAGYTQAFLPVWAQKDFGAWSTFGGGGYDINPGPGNRNYTLAGWAVTRQVTKRLNLGMEIYHQTPDVVGGKALTAVAAGVIYQLTKHFALMGSAGPAIRTDTHAGQGVFYASLQFTN